MGRVGGWRLFAATLLGSAYYQLMSALQGTGYEYMLPFFIMTIWLQFDFMQIIREMGTPLASARPLIYAPPTHPPDPRPPPPAPPNLRHTHTQSRLDHRHHHGTTTTTTTNVGIVTVQAQTTTKW